MAVSSYGARHQDAAASSASSRTSTSTCPAATSSSSRTSSTAGSRCSTCARNLLARRPGQPRGVRPARPRGPAEGRPRPDVRRLQHPARLRGRLRPRRGRALPQPRRRPHLQRAPDCRPRPDAGTPGLDARPTEPGPGVDEERDRGGRPRAPRRHRRGRRPRRPPRHADRVARMYDRDRRRPPRGPPPPPPGHLRGRPRRDGDGPRHPAVLDVRAPPGAVHRARPTWPTSPTTTAGSSACRSSPGWSTATPGAPRSRSG